MSMKNIFDEDGVDDEFHINEQYASKYDGWRRNEELQKLKDKYGDVDDLEESESSSSDDEFAEPDNPKFNKAFLKALSAIQSKEYSDLKGKPFFTEEDYGPKKKKEKEEKPMTLKDYERHIILDHGGRLKMTKRKRKYEYRRSSRKKNVSFRTNDDLINGFKNDVESSDDDDLFTSGLFKVKESQKVEKKHEEEDEEDVINFVKGKKKSLKDKEDEAILQTLRDKWSNPNISKDEKWLADFFLNQKYLEEEDGKVERAYNETVIDEETLSDDEKTLEKMDDFDRQYRFRFEEPEQEFLKHYPRNIEDSLRAKKQKRKEVREAYEKRKKEEKEQKRQEIARLKSLKYQEIQDKIQKIKQASGNEDIDLGNDELEEDFDPEAHDAKMANMFGDNYYNMEDEDDRKPVFSDDDDDLKDYDEYVDKYGKSVVGGGGDDSDQCDDGEEQEEQDYDENFDYENFNMDADYDPNEESKNNQQEVTESSSRVNRRRKSKFARALKKKKPVFNPDEKDFDSYFNEYYNLDFEDIVGGVPCRYKYRKVEANDFGLSTEEILNAGVTELQKWIPIRQILRHDRTDAMEKRDRINYRQRAEMLHIKQKILPSLFAENPEDILEAEEEKKRQKNLKKKLRRQKKLEEQESMLGEGSTELDDGENTERSRKKRELEGANTKSPKKKRKEEEEEEKEDEVKEDQNGEVETPKKKKKKKKKLAAIEGHQEPEVETETFTEERIDEKTTEEEEEYQEPEMEIPTEESHKKKKKVVEENQENENKKKKKKKKKKNKEEAEEEEVKAQDVSEVIKPPRKEKRKWKKNGKEDPFLQGICDARLAAYGANPKKIKNRVKYGKKSVD
ncbi:protein KRI1 homolog [Penaeus chinensis]|uniref:protein KRI1 homolog n=1 Tax=Penaeus chinensis TaxID=139456 RepID=UPI001FB72A62|nr:protein KRI1 homolog [Penaeus chinensis]